MGICFTDGWLHGGRLLNFSLDVKQLMFVVLVDVSTFPGQLYRVILYF